jgi:hypothetical protein
MFKIITITITTLITLTLSALAGPEGTFTLRGTNPGGQGEYSGTVSVRQTGQTYSVIWNVGGVKYTGTGLGAENSRGYSTMGPASSSDSSIAISYISDGTFGLAYYVEQDDGTWRGIWTYGGSDKIGTEIWSRR